ncbi:MAG: zinc-dependent metalloprotease family protein [Planctomycetota bacterium]
MLCAQFDIAAGTVQHLEVLPTPDGDRAVRVDFAGTVFTLALMPHDVRSADFQLLVRDDNGIHAVPRPASVTYRGSALEDPNSWVAATIEGPQLKALVRMADGDLWVIQPVREVQPNAGPALHVVFRSTDSANLPWNCGVQGSLTAPVPTPVQTDVTLECEIACEADFQYYQLNGSNSTATQNDITGVINAVETIYLADVQIGYALTQILVNTSSATNPYTSSVAGTLLNQFRNNWNGTHGGIQRDIAHLFTGRPMGQSSGGAIGIAFVSSVCTTSGYGVSQSRWTGNFALRVAVTAHEIGHNFSAQHCDAVPPCNIMCSGAGGCSGNVSTFSQNERNQIVGFANTRNCLTVVPSNPVISSVTPSAINTFAPGTVTLSGSGFLGTTQVQIGSTVLTSGFTTPDDNTLRFNPPPGLPVGIALINVTNSAGTGASGMFVQATDPCQMTVNGAVLGGQTLTWTMGGGLGNAWVLLLGPGPSTTPFQGWPIIDNLFLLGFGFLDPQNGMATMGVPVPAGSLSGQTIWSQMVELLPSTTALTVDSSSTVRSTLIFN